MSSVGAPWFWTGIPLRLTGNWIEGGPVPPIEFSRVSDNGRLTLVIDERHGTDVQTRYALSVLDELDEAITDLQRREGAPVRNRIGFIDVARDLTCDRSLAKEPVACARIRAWARDRHLDAVVWTAIDARFRKKTGVPFSVDVAVQYLAGLLEPARTLALDYIRKASSDVVTPVRSKAAAMFGFSKPTELVTSK